jgi:hypothetical protein
MLSRVESAVTHFLKAGTFDVSTLGRSADKLSRLMQACKELPGDLLRDEDLHSVADWVRSGLNPYDSKPQKESCGKSDTEGSRDEPQQSNLSVDPNSSNQQFVDTTTAKPVIADRIKWLHSPAFDPRPFLTDPVVRKAFDDPETLRLPQSLWIKRPVGRVHCSRSEVLKLATKWDQKGALRIFPCDSVNHDEAVGIFAVSKDQDWDRLILNPVVINGRMQAYSNYTKSLAPGCLIGLVQLANDEVLRISADDLAEMYYTFSVPDARAKRNCIRMKFKPHELRHLSAFDPSLHRSECYVALGSLAMGDSLAVEIAQQAHHQVLQQLAGSLRECERVAYRKAFPRGKFFEFLAIDDHLGLQVVSRAAWRNSQPARDTEVFHRAGIAYKQVGLIQHPKKKRRGVVNGTFLGADVDGLAGRVSAPRHRIGLLCLCTAILARKGCTTQKLLSCIVGSWISVLMFRRPIMSIMSAVFQEGVGKPPNQVFRLSQQARNELLGLCILGPVAQTDMRVETCPHVFCMDASPHGAGIVQVPEAVHVVAELWRHAEQRGFYTRLEASAASLLRELEIDAEPSFGQESALHLLGPPSFPPPKHLREGYLFDCIELFKGEGNWSFSHAAVGFKVHGGVDSNRTHVAFGDLLDPAVFYELRSLAYRGVVREWHGGPPCFTYGTLRRPRIRSKAQPAGFNPDDPLTREQNSLARRIAFLFCIVIRIGGFVSIEQPGSSVMFYMHCFQVLAMMGCVLSKFCFCAYGSAFKKPSKWLHNKPWLLELETKCTCSSAASHCLIEGTFTKDKIKDFESKCRPNSTEVYGRPPRLGESVASYSASYPIPLMRRMALGSLNHSQGQSVVIPLSRKLACLSELGCETTPVPGWSSDAQPALRPWHEDPDWIGELADSLHFRELLRYRFLKQGHINVLECRTYKTWLKYCCKHHQSSRILGLLDSRVTLGATAKGRSSSFALSRVLQTSLGYIIMGGLYPGGLHVSTHKNRSDGPSRNRRIPAPTKEEPWWLRELREHRYEAFDAVLAAAQFPQVQGRWVRLLLLLCGDIERNPGPVRQHAAGVGASQERVPRGSFDLGVGYSQATAQRMDQCFAGFVSWMSEAIDCRFDEISGNVHAVALALRGYGCYLYEKGFPRYLLVYAITSVQDRFPHFRGFLAPAWQIDRKWQLAEPGECRPVISAPILRAAVSLALLWGWQYWAAVSMLGFLGMLHPAEFLALRRRDLVLPGDSLQHHTVVYVHVRHPKTARFARRQHAKIEDALIVRYIEMVYGGFSLDAKLFPGSASVYRRQWDRIMERLEIPHTRKHRGATPAVLRGSGATHLYLATEDIQLIQWRGRWTKLKTVEYYLQEVAAQVILHQLNELARHRIQFLSEHSSALVCYVIADAAAQRSRIGETDDDDKIHA